MESHAERSRRMNVLLIDAIVRKAPDLVTGMLEMGADVNHTVRFPLLKDVQYQTARGTPCVKSDARICSPSSNAYTTPMHVAVLNAMLYPSRDLSGGSREAIEIVKILLNYGANMNMTSTKMIVCNATKQTSEQVVPEGTPLETAMFVKDTLLKTTGWDSIVNILKLTPDTPLIVPTMAMPTVVYKRWSAMLTEGTFSDVTFVCADGKEVAAHTSVLAHASEYFRRLFDGPWKKETLRLDVTADVIHGILSHVYIGEIDVDVVARHAADFLRLSQEYLLSDLEALTDAHLACNVTLENLETLLILSELHGAAKLKKSCLDFVCSNKATALTRMMHLAITHPDLWTQMVDVASVDEPAHKKQRTS